MVDLLTNDVEQAVTPLIMHFGGGGLIYHPEILLVIQDGEHLGGEVVALIQWYVEVLDADCQL